MENIGLERGNTWETGRILGYDITREHIWKKKDIQIQTCESKVGNEALTYQRIGNLEYILSNFESNACWKGTGLKK